MKFKCPKCKRTLFNRRAVKCEFCSAPLPPELRFSDDEVKRQQRLKDLEYAEHRKQMKRLEGFWPGRRLPVK